jgi:hypothetical protein
VLERGDHARALQATHVRGAERRHEVRILADGLLDPAPAVVANHVEHRRESLVDAQRGHVPPDRRGHPLDQVGVEGGAPGDRRRVDGGAVRGEPGQALLVDQGGDAQARAVDDHPLLADQLRGTVLRRHRVAAVHPGEVAEPVPRGVGQRHRARGGEHVLHRRDVAGTAGRRRGAGVGGVFGDVVGGLVDVPVDPAAAQLRELLLERHLGEEEVDPHGDGQRHVVPGSCRGHRRGRRGGLLRGRHERALLHSQGRDVASKVSSAPFTFTYRDCRIKPLTRPMRKPTFALKISR